MGRIQGMKKNLLGDTLEESIMNRAGTASAVDSLEL